MKIPMPNGGTRLEAVDEYWLNEEQALLVAVLSDAPAAPAVRAMLIRTFVAWRRGKLGARPGNCVDVIELRRPTPFG